MRKLFVFFLMGLYFCSCDKVDVAGVFKGSDPDVNVRFANSQVLNESEPLQDIVAGQNDYQLYIVTDIHSKGECPKLVRFVSACLADSKVEHFVLCLGDVVDGRYSYSSIRRDFSPLIDAGWTVFATPGNHDICFDLYSQYQEIWPRTTYQFKVVTPSAGTDLFICLDSAEGTLGTRQRAWLEKALSAAQNGNYRNIYVFTHTHFFKKDNSQSVTGNYALEETMDLTSLFARYGVGYVLCGHDHHFEHTKFRGVDYYVFNCLSKKEPTGCYRATCGDNFSFEEIKSLDLSAQATERLNEQSVEVATDKVADNYRSVE